MISPLISSPRSACRAAVLRTGDELLTCWPVDLTQHTQSFLLHSSISWSVSVPLPHINAWFGRFMFQIPRWMWLSRTATGNAGKIKQGMDWKMRELIIFNESKESATRLMTNGNKCDGFIIYSLSPLLHSGELWWRHHSWWHFYKSNDDACTFCTCNVLGILS